MQKIVSFLEANVEWFVLLLAVAYLGWASWAYLLNDPVARPLENVEVSPGSVDKFIQEHAAQRLADKINAEVQPPSFEVKDFSSALTSSINLDDLNPPQLAAENFDYAPFDSTNVPGQVPSNKGNPVQELPNLPSAHALLALAGLDTLAPPAQAAAGGAAPAQAAAAPGKDVRLVVAAFTIPWSELYEQWNKAFGAAQPGGQPRLSPAEFQLLQITAFRSEKIGGQWTEDPNPIQIINGSDLPPYPAAGNKTAELSYLEALAKSPKTIATPDIPAVAAGAAWKDPIQFLPGAGQQNNQTPQDQGNGQSFAPGTRYPGVATMANPSNATNKLDTTDVQYRPPGGAGGGGGFRGGPPPGFRPPSAPVAPPSDQTPDQQPAAPAIPPADGTVTPVAVLANPSITPSQLPQEISPKLNIVSMQAKMPDLCVYVIDTTASAGKTYRYRISYKVFNPLYNKGAQRVVKAHQAWLNQFDIAAPLSEWSPEITVPKQTYFFCGQPKGVRVAASSNSFPFDVFTWSNGKWQKDTFNASFGDPIGGAVGSIDYSTGYTFVDRRPGRTSSKTFITLVDREGNVDVREAASDNGSPDYKKVTQWLTQPATTGQPAVGVPGGPGGPGGPMGGPYGPGGPGGPGGPFGPGGPPPQPPQ